MCLVFRVFCQLFVVRLVGVPELDLRGFFQFLWLDLLALWCLFSEYSFSSVVVRPFGGPVHILR